LSATDYRNLSDRERAQARKEMTAATENGTHGFTNAIPPAKSGVLFVCKMNSCRSQMADGFLSHFISTGQVSPALASASCGLNSSQVNPNAVKVMGEIGIDISGAASKPLAGMGKAKDWSAVISLCGCGTSLPPDWAPEKHELFEDWQLDDPPALDTGDLSVYRRVRGEVRERVLKLAAKMSDDADKKFQKVKLEETKDYYGKVLSKSDDLKTNACCTAARPPDHIVEALLKIHDSVTSKYYGCGLCIPDELEGQTVLDLGCGAGRDVYLISQLVGGEGHVIGVDMTEEQLATARDTLDHHMKAFGYNKPNVSFLHGYIEDLEGAGVEPGSVDIAVSNCVVNLSPDKPRVLAGVYKALKEGGEFYFSDVYASRRVPDTLQQDPELWGECLSGALYWNDFVRLAKEAGFGDPRLVKDSKITVQNKRIEQIIGGQVEFYSATYRLFKLPGKLEPDCEDYGQAVVYKGTIKNSPHSWDLDNHHCMEKGKVFPVCGNTYHMVHSTRFNKHFEYYGDMSTHFGIFSGCGKNIPFESAKAQGSREGGSCC